MLPYALTIFTGAFLIFQIQPLIAKYILPWFGGSSAVWTTSMLFFQVFLLGGYAYAHLLTRWLRPRVQAVVHVVLLLLALTQLPITPADALQPTPTASPTWGILVLLTASIGLPYLVLSASAPLIQAWVSQTDAQRSPYRLYGLSNFGSLLALLSYPVVVEPVLTRSAQAALWGGGFGLYVVACSTCAVLIWKWGDGAQRHNRASEPDATPPTPGLWAIWLALSGVAVLLLLAVTNQITQDVPPVPFLWVLPLSLYLLTFIIAFENERWYVRPVVATAIVPAIEAVIVTKTTTLGLAIVPQIVVYSAALFVCCLFCHGELSRLKPQPRYLTSFYLTVALGGALGGIFAALVAPVVFDSYFELYLGFLAVGGLALVVFLFNKNWTLFGERPAWIWAALIGGYLLLALSLGLLGIDTGQDTLLTTRSFYGVLAVRQDLPGTADAQRWLEHGGVAHGLQFTAPGSGRRATAYYGENSGVGLALRYFPWQGERRIGVVGLGIGTLAVYGRQGDYMRFYEINPDVRHIAETYFTYVADSPAQIDIVMGDARLSMEQEAPQAFGVLILDAFNGDAVPVHLLTREAFETYLRHVQPEGVIAVHISSQYLDLQPVVRHLADEFDMSVVLISNTPGPVGVYEADWMLVTRNRAFLYTAKIAGATSAMEEDRAGVRLWTDDYTSLFPILRLQNPVVGYQPQSQL